jgi:hypothetical protein
VYPLNKIKANSMQLNLIITFYIQSLNFLRIKKLNSSLVLGDKTVMLAILVFLILIFILSFSLVCF